MSSFIIIQKSMVAIVRKISEYWTSYVALLIIYCHVIFSAYTFFTTSTLFVDDLSAYIFLDSLESVSNDFVYNKFFAVYIYLNPEIWLLSLTCLLLIFCLIYSSPADVEFLPKIHFFSIIIIICTFLFVYFFSFDMFIYDSLFDYFHYLRTDYNSIIELVILLISSIILFYTYNYNKCIGIYSLEYYIITLFCICSFCLFIHCNNIIFMYVLIELQSIGSYVLAAIYRNNRYSIEAGLKYFIIGSFSSIIILFGLSLIYGFSGLVLLDDISLYVRGLSYSEDSFSYSSLLFALTFFNIGFLFKIYAAPFHFWVSDIYQGSPTSVTIFLSTIPVISYVYVFIKLFVNILSEFSSFYCAILYFFSIASMLLGVFGALIQRKIKKLIAYSSVSTVGYVLAGLSINTISSVQYSIFYLLIYVFNVIPIFILLLNYRISNKYSMDHISSLASLCHQNKWLFLFYVSAFFSLAGIPPFSGFASKFYILNAIGYSASYIILAIVLLTSILSCYYYLRVVKMIYYDSRESFFISKLTYSTCFAMSWFFILNICFFFFSFIAEDICLYISLCLYLG